MAKFVGAIGYGHTVKTSPGVWEKVVTERSVYGDLLRNSRAREAQENVNDELTVGNSISIVADAYANEQNFFAMLYVMWAGTRWVISNVDVEGPRLILRLGGVYHGPTPVEGSTPSETGSPTGQ